MRTVVATRQAARTGPAGIIDSDGIGDGLIAVVRPGADASWADTVLRVDVTGTWVWSVSHGPAEHQGLLACERPGIRAVALSPAGSDPGQVRAAVQLSARLRQARTDRGWSLAYLTSPTRPRTGPGLVRVPHLVSVDPHTHGLTDPDAAEPWLTDTVVWELTTESGARRWLGGPLPDQSLVEACLPGLLALRGAARKGCFPPTPAGGRLAALMHGRPQPLSTLLVYRHLPTFTALFTEPPTRAGVSTA
jgi:hypothetical protein